MQRLGGTITLATAPLLLSYPESGQSANEVTARRRLTYQMMGASEVVLGLLTLSQYLTGGSGLSDRNLLIATGTMAGFASMRAYFLYMKPAWMKPESTIKKAQ